MVSGPPAWIPAAIPDESIVAIELFEDDQVTELAKFCVLLSVNVPVAVNCRSLPTATIAVFGVTAIDTTVAGVTLSVAEPKMLPEVAEIVVLCPTPPACAVARPPAVTEAAAGFSEAQVTDPVRSFVLPSV